MLEEIGVDCKSLNDYENLPEVIEDGQSFFENALKKAKAVSEWTGEAVLADDSGLEVKALGGAPGIFSARYAGNSAEDDDNIKKLLENLKGVPEDKRDGAFRCVLVLYYPDGHYKHFEGSWEGRIAEVPAGTGGFGYDPVFYLPESGVTVAELPREKKNAMSHRAKAFRQLKYYLQNTE